jgi:hypothetical protein
MLPFQISDLLTPHRMASLEVQSLRLLFYNYLLVKFLKSESFLGEKWMKMEGTEVSESIFSTTGAMGSNPKSKNLIERA